MKSANKHREPSTEKERIDWMEYSGILGRINLVYNAHLISEVEYNRAVDQLRRVYHVISHITP